MSAADRPPQEQREAARRVLGDLERRLETLEQAGVRHLNLPAASPPLAPPAAAPRIEAPASPTPPAAPPTAPQRPGPPPAADPSAPGDEATPERGAGAPPHPSTLDTLESLRFQYRDCRACGLSETRTRLVFGVGSDRPRLMFIGEGPGADEDAQGLPFVGRAGQLLTGLIQAMGLVRDDVYITNVVKCRPPGNRNPAPAEMASCRPILQRQIELLDPALIVALGNVPLKALNPAAGGITRERGRRFSYQRWTVLPTFHPSYLLRNPAAIGDCWTDLRQALEVAYPAAPGDAADPDPSSAGH